MPINFPASPTANQVYTDSVSGITYKYNFTYNVWTANVSSSGSSGSGSGIAGVQVISANTTAVSGNLYVLTANIGLTLPASPSNTPPSIIYVSNRSGFANSVILRNNEKIMGLAENLEIDAVDIGITLIYSGNSQGWIIL